MLDLEAERMKWVTQAEHLPTQATDALDLLNELERLRQVETECRETIATLRLELRAKEFAAKTLAACHTPLC